PFLLSAGVALASRGINNVETCADSARALEMLRERQFSVVVLDLIMPNVSGMELLEHIRREFPDVVILMLTAINEVETAVKCMQMGAFDYILKPVDHTRLVTTLKRAIEFQEMKAENRTLKKYLLGAELDHPEVFTEIITQNDRMKAIFHYMEAISPSPLPVLITGDTGVGKELIARAIHNLSGRKGELITVNVAGLDDHLFSDALFGHKKGAFTGADRDRGGLIEKAAGGTIFLDEIGDLRMESQVKLLRLLQDDSSFYPIGSDVVKRNEARVIVATNANLLELQQGGKFRKDLYYRLQTYHIKVPPLRERKDDIPALVEFFFEKAARRLAKTAPKPPKELFTLLGNYSFPGNIRELEAMIYDAISRHQTGRLSLESFREKILPEHHHEMVLGGESVVRTPEEGNGEEQRMLFPEQLPTLREMEQQLISEALKRTDGNQRQAAELIGLSRRALNNRLSRGLFTDEDEE
ncbi:MAG: sigma-54-dependent Fis family transcriptional regulator, partial [Calditrichaeota bacterium]|nr:sigma-54-dependent Fis family transcriptional regulator [Calditrichota bacterium]